MTTNTSEKSLSSLFINYGSHNDRVDGLCLMEAVAWFAGESHSDRPNCTDVALAAFGRSLNDRLRDEERQQLKDLIPLLVGTRGSSKLAKRRAFYLVDRYLRSILPAFFRDSPTRPRTDIAARLEELPPVIDEKSADQACDLARAIRDEVRNGLPVSYATYDAAAAYAVYAAYDAAAAYAVYAASTVASDDAAYAVAAAAYAASDVAVDAAYAVSDATAASAAAYAASRARTIERSIASFREAIAITEETGGAS